MLDTTRLTKIITTTTAQFRKGEVTTTKTMPNGIEVTDVYMMPHIDEASKGLVMVDMWFIEVGVKQEMAQEYRDELVSLLKEWPEDTPLSGGLSYIVFGGVLGSQDLALMLMALGSVLGFWKVITPKVFGDIDKAMADELAGSGFIMASGYIPEVQHA